MCVFVLGYLFLSCVCVGFQWRCWLKLVISVSGLLCCDDSLWDHEEEPQTWRVDQGHVVSFLQTPSLHQQRRHPLRPFVQLQAGERARHRPLEEVRTGWAAAGAADLSDSVAGGRCCYPRAEQRVEDVVRGGLGSPLQDLRQEEELQHRKWKSYEHITWWLQQWLIFCVVLSTWSCFLAEMFKLLLIKMLYSFCVNCCTVLCLCDTKTQNIKYVVWPNNFI